MATMLIVLWLAGVLWKDEIQAWGQMISRKFQRSQPLGTCPNWALVTNSSDEVGLVLCMYAYMNIWGEGRSPHTGPSYVSDVRSWKPQSAMTCWVHQPFMVEAPKRIKHIQTLNQPTVWLGEEAKARPWQAYAQHSVLREELLAVWSSLCSDKLSQQGELERENGYDQNILCKYETFKEYKTLWGFALKILFFLRFIFMFRGGREGRERGRERAAPVEVRRMQWLP